ncbi:Beta-lactamase class C-like protein [Ignavibacterium album JCM 16511]|uniref:Beta-lactamase class C-like protein n=1 Tax=Ignavibacterium album (strain DSM 19864 / JCM 16511 / NBRC 101810 / Mat9-16) TaxID=945713 RepID=I0AKA9_IGNAJ|nr:serine hydrolase domain-containing protein [Ignavibacterium album]AFH49416.1 Beta-lactamase class C-like protein [Ignavibacterium album JCM 16511]
MNLLKRKSPFVYIRILILFISFILISSTNLYSQKNDIETFKKLSSYLQTYIDYKRIPSISAGVYRKDKIYWLDAKGLIDLENFVPAKNSSLYRIASITKSITAVAVMQLYEKGIIDLDAEINTYVPYFPKKKWKLTVRHILNHTGGIRSYKSDEEFNSKMFYSTTRDAVLTFANDDLLFEPGTRYNYTSLGYSLLAALIENVSKTSFENYLRKNIFEPAGMKSTRVDRQRSIIYERVRGYEKSPDRRFINSPLADLSLKVAGGGLISTSEDLLLFVKALFDGILISKSTLEMMTKPTILKTGQKINYGFGFSLSDPSDSIKWFGHEGRGTGFSSGLIILPEEEIAAVYLINIRDRNLGNPARDLIQIIKGKEIRITKTLADHLFDKYNSFGIDSLLFEFNRLYDIQDPEFNFSIDECVYVGTALSDINRIADAIRYLRVLNRRNPNNFVILKALGDAYNKDKNDGLALRYYREALELKPDDSYVKNMIDKLTKK